MSSNPYSSKKYDIHPDFLKYQNQQVPLSPVKLPIINFLLTKMLNRVPIPNGLTETKHTIKGYKDAPIGLSIFSANNQNTLQPTLVYFHGGAFALQAAHHHKWLACEYALQTPCKVIFVDYHLLPKATFPTGLEDCYAAFRWVFENAESLGIDSNRIAVGGDSAGGALTAGVCLLAKERQVPMPCFQMLIYPVTDERQTNHSIKTFINTPLWDSNNNAKMWKLYLKNGISGKREYASPAEAATLEGMPPTYIEVAEYDCLRDEGIAYAKKLADSGVVTELHETKRTVHGFEIVRQNEITLASLAKRVEILQKALHL